MTIFSHKNSIHFYFHKLPSGFYIDDSYDTFNNNMRYVNHSCSNNAEIQYWSVGNELRIMIVAKELILKDREITINYDWPPVAG